MSRIVIVNADDLGLCEGVNRAVFEAAAAGSVTSASLMVGQPGWTDALARIRTSESSISIGLHFNLTVGRPLTGGRTLTEKNGRFLSLAALTLRATSGRVDPDEAYAEAAAQLEMLVAAGIPPSHVDSHRHVHMLIGIGPAVREAARRAGVRFVRRPFEPYSEMVGRPGVALKQAMIRASGKAAGLGSDSTVHFRGISLMDVADFGAAFCGLIGRLPEGVTEIAVHPSYVTPELESLDPYIEGRERELRALTSSEVVARLRDGTVRLAGFDGI
jgi:predicted glycoside hydrolase/deacetylase ChbG (UPF0249 family)